MYDFWFVHVKIPNGFCYCLCHFKSHTDDFKDHPANGLFSLYIYTKNTKKKTLKNYTNNNYETACLQTIWKFVLF